MNIPCANFSPCPDVYPPYTNLSSEDPDRFSCIGRSWGNYQSPPRLGSAWRESNCYQTCELTLSDTDLVQCRALGTDMCSGECVQSVSQKLADQCAENLSQCGDQCDTTGRVCFSNTTQVCTVTCPDGTEFSYTVAAGTFSATSVDIANSQAYSFACNQANTLKHCASTQHNTCNIASTSPLPSAVLNTSYHYQILGSATGILNTFSLVSGALPPGLSMNATGLVSGTPTAIGTYNFAVRLSSPVISCAKSFALTVKSNVYACYPCDEPNGSPALVDKISGFNMSAVGGSLVSGPGKIGTAVKFGWNFPSAKITYANPTVGTNSHWNLSGGSFTVRFWLNLTPDIFALNNWVFFAIEAISGLDLYYGISDNTIHYEIQLGGIWRDISYTLGGAGWHRVILWHEKGVGIGLKIDNNAAVTLADTHAQPSENRGIGFFTDSNAAGSYGYVDDVAVWTKKLTDAEMLTDWNLGNGTSCSP